uniref:TIR domain-containing protein n=1 Tax=Oncorhynchus tshawytscha TaxID=74940 RepID=A0AAZ3PVS5_ONCTS
MTSAGQSSTPEVEKRSTCDQCDERLFCNCSSRNYQHVPTVTVTEVVTLDLSFNDITSVAEDDLREYTWLRTLDLRSNRIQSIHEWAFHLLQGLESLDMSYNQLAALNPAWFSKLLSLQHLNLLGSCYRTLGPGGTSLTRLRFLRFGNPALEEVRRGDLAGVRQLDQLEVYGNNLKRYDPGSLGDLWPLGVVTLRLRGPFQDNTTLVSSILHDVSYSETFLVVADVLLSEKTSIAPFRETNRRRVRSIMFQNATLTDEAIVHFMEVCPVYVMPCLTSLLLTQMVYLDLSGNLLTDLTLTESLCHGIGILRNLRVINVSDNALKSISLISKLVTRLDKLVHLDISQNAYTSMPPTCSWPQILTHLNLSRAKLRRVTPCLPSTLEILDLGHNDLTAFHSVALPALRELHLSGNKLMSLPPGWLFPSLEVLLIQSNTLNMFGPLDLRLYRRLRALQAGQNRFVCSCEFVNFMVWRWGGAVEGSVELTDRWDNYLCDSPLPLQGQRVDRVQLSLFQCHRILLVSSLCGCMLASGILFVILLWKIHAVWYVRMMWAWLKAKRNSGNQKRRDAAGNAYLLCYDAFVSYSEQDAEWVEEFLVPELEDSQPPLSLCLHKRDFLPGHWIIDNIIHAMERSRRTLFVLSEHFVHSEWCRYELDFSHFRLFDGDSEAAVLVLLEPISKDDVPKRFCKLRKLMSSRTYLEWPQEDERRAEFWSNLRLAVRGGDEL